MNTNQHTKALKIAASQYALTVAALKKIEDAVASKSLPNIDSRVAEKARFDLEDCLARRALGEATAEEEMQARTALESAEHELANRQAAYATENLEMKGLNRRLLTAQQGEPAAKHALIGAEEAWILEELRIADEAYTKQAEEIYRSFERVEACAAALKKRGLKESVYFALSGDLAIPTIGPASCAAVLPKLTVRERDACGFGKLLFNAGRRVTRYQPKTEDVERDLLAVTTNDSDSKVGRFAKIVGSLIPGA